MLVVVRNVVDVVEVDDVLVEVEEVLVGVGDVDVVVVEEMAAHPAATRPSWMKRKTRGSVARWSSCCSAAQIGESGGRVSVAVTPTPPWSDDLYPTAMHLVSVGQSTPWSSVDPVTGWAAPGEPLVTGTTTPWRRSFPTAMHSVTVGQVTSQS